MDTHISQTAAQVAVDSLDACSRNAACMSLGPAFVTGKLDMCRWVLYVPMPSDLSPVFSSALPTSRRSSSGSVSFFSLQNFQHLWEWNITICRLISDS